MKLLRRIYEIVRCAIPAMLFVGGPMLGLYKLLVDAFCLKS